MSRQSEALKMALEALCNHSQPRDGYRRNELHLTPKPHIELYEEAIETIKKTLAEPEQEPVAWVNRDELDNMLDDQTAIIVGQKDGFHKTPLYIAPPVRKPLTDEEIDALFNSQAWVSVVFFDAYGKPLERASSRDFARAIERAHGIGGTGQ